MVSEVGFHEPWRLSEFSYRKSLTLVAKKSGRNEAEDSNAFAKPLV